MTTERKAKLNKSDDQTNIDKYRVAANIAECHIVSKLVIISNFMMIGHLLYVNKNLKIVVDNVESS